MDGCGEKNGGHEKGEKPRECGMMGQRGNAEQARKRLRRGTMQIIRNTSREKNKVACVEWLGAEPSWRVREILTRETRLYETK